MEDSMNILFITDEGHGWGIISEGQLRGARMTLDDLSSYSYQTPKRPCSFLSYQTPNGNIFALEEDVDFPKYLNKLDSLGIKYEITDRYVPEGHDDNPRSWDRIERFEDGGLNE
jgi:hypothetical protein